MLSLIVQIPHAYSLTYDASMMISRHAVMNLDGNEVAAISPHQQVTITVSFHHLENRAVLTEPLTSYLWVLEIRDSDGFTRYIVWQSGVIEPGSRNTVSASWLAEEPSTYTARSFIMRGLMGTPLSAIEQSTIEVR